jgi:Prenyltransferase and squalene oxidase repeat
MPTRLIEIVMASTGGMTIGGLFLRLALVALSVFATIHLFSLWGTRYGDNNTSAKSFFLSLVLHCCFGLGWVTVAETYPRRAIGTDPSEAHTPITFVDTEDVAPRQGTSKLPVFSVGQPTNDGSWTRDPRGKSRVDRDDESSDAEATRVDLTSIPENSVAPDVPTFAAEMDEQAPGLEQSTASMAQSSASSRFALDDPSPEARPELAMPAKSVRTSISRSATNESNARPDFQRGMSSKTTPLLEDGASMTLPSEISMDSLPKPESSPNSESIRRIGSPGPTSLIDTQAGSGPVGTENTQAVASPKKSARIARTSNRPGEGRDDAPPSRPAIASASSTLGRGQDDRLLINRGPSETFEDVTQPAFIKPTAPPLSRAPARALETYQARTSGQRMATVLKHGGSEESEKAVENSLKWMASIQEPEGHWSSARHGGGADKVDPQGQDRAGGGKFADSGVTGLVVLSFLGAGYTHERGPYTAEVRKALNWLIARQSANGYLGGNATRLDQNYCHAIATFALAEAYAMQKNPADFQELKNAVRKGVQMISVLQNADGGWRYGKGGESSESDMSMFGWQLMALKSAVNAGIPVPEETRRGMTRFLESRRRGQQGGLAGYRVKDEPTPAMTAEALFCRQMFAIGTNTAATREAVAYLRANLPKVTKYDEYYWYYGTLAMHHLQDDSWKEWNAALRDMLISQQRQEGPLAGSWDPTGKWAGIGGRLYSTALSTMCLEVYYRYTSIAKIDESK